VGYDSASLTRRFETTKQLPESKTGMRCYWYNYFAPLLLSTLGLLLAVYWGHNLWP